MRINDLLSEGLTPTVSGKEIFIKTLVNQIHEYIDSVRQTKQPLKIMDFVDSYMSQYGWVMNPQQKVLVQSACTDVDDEYNYFLKKAEKAPAASAGSKAFDQMANQLQQPDQAGANAMSQMASQLTPQQQQNWAPSADSPAVWKSNRTGQSMTGKPAVNPTWKPGKDSPAVWKSNRTGKHMNEGVLDWAKAKAGTMAGSFASKMGLGSVTKLANAIYSVAATQQRDQTGKAIGTVDNPVLANPTKQIIKTMTPMKGEDYKDDLESIVRLALNNLYKTDPGDYSSEVKRIMGTKTSQNPTP